MNGSHLGCCKLGLQEFVLHWFKGEIRSSHCLFWSLNVYILCHFQGEADDSILRLAKTDGIVAK